jgi:DNA-binding NarL/FixJ family response regulator
MNVKLLVADHQEVMRIGLKSLVSRSTIEVAAEASTETELMRLLQKQLPCVLILDVRFAGEDGFATLAKIKRKWSNLPVLMWSTDDNPTYIARALALRAGGYLPRSVGRNELLGSIRAVAAGEEAWSPEQKKQYTGAPD